MGCDEVRAQLLAPEPSAAIDLAEHVSSCPACARLAAASDRLDDCLRASLLRTPPEALQASLASVPAGDAALRIEQAMRSALVPEVPDGLRARLARLAPSADEAAARIDSAVHAAVVAVPPPALQAQLASLASDPRPADALGWLAETWRTLRARPALLAGQLAAVAVLGYVAVQLFAWLGTLPLVVGDIPYALELLVLSPAVDYLGQLEGLAQQLALWLLVAAAGWILVQGVSPRRQAEP